MIFRFYLDLINPLRGLGQTELLHLIEQGQRGFLARLQWLYYFVEKRDPMVRATKRRLMSALGQLDWDIKMGDAGEDEQKKAMAQKQADDLRAAYDLVANLHEALQFLCLADLRGYSHLEKIYENDDSQGAVTELRIVDQWFWCRQGKYGDWQYNNSAIETNMGIAIDPTKFIIREVEDPADEIFAELAVKRKVNDQDWDGFLEDYGVPPMFVVGPPNIPADKEKEYQRIAEEAVSRRRGYLPNGASMESPNVGGAGGVGIFAERLKYIDEQIVVAGTSGLLTVLVASGSGTLAGEAQKDAFDQITDAIAAGVSSVMQKQFDAPILARLYPDQPVLAYFQFARTEPERVAAVLDEAKTAAEAGYAIDEAQLSEKAGWKLQWVGRRAAPKETLAAPGSGEEAAADAAPGKGQGAAVSSPPGETANSPTPAQEPIPIHPLVGSPTQEPPPTHPLAGSPIPSAVSAPLADPEKLNTLLQTASQQLAEADAADLAPLRRAIESALVDPTPERLQALLDELPQLQQQLGVTSAEVLRRTMGAALAQGATS